MDLLQNPFYILNASPRDNKRRIMELADERSLLLDSSECMEARSNLTNPRKRLSAEVAWLPGIGPKRANELLSLIESSPMALLQVCRTEKLSFQFSVETTPVHPPKAIKLSPIVRANLLAAGLMRVTGQNADEVAEWILELSLAFEDVESNELSVLINEERIVSGFPEVSDLSAAESEIQERRRHFRQVIKSALDNLSPKELVEAVTVAVEAATDNGEDHGPILIADIIDFYEVEAQGFLEKEEANIKYLVERIKAAIDDVQSDSVLDFMVNQLAHVVKNWDYVAQPIQVSTKSRGLNHDASHRVASLVRNLALHMFNEHDKLDYSQQITKLLQEVFAEVGEVAERTAEDANALDEISERKKLSSLLDPISELCRAAIKSAEDNPSSANMAAQKILNCAPQLIKNLAKSSSNRNIVSEGRDEIAIALMHCCIVYANKTRKWKECVPMLELAINYAINENIKSKIQSNLIIAKDNERIFGGLAPISSAPDLSTFNGIGTKMYGSSNFDSETMSYISTLYFVFFYIPIFPLSRYRVVSVENGYQFLGKARLRTCDKWHIAVSFFIIGIIIINM